MPHHHVGLRGRGRGRRRPCQKRSPQAARLTPTSPYLLGELETHLVTVRSWRSRVWWLPPSDYDFEPTLDTANRVLVRKTVAAKAALATAEKALEAAGGRGFFRSFYPWSVFCGTSTARSSTRCRRKSSSV